MKKKIFAILLAGTLVLSSSPPVFADEKDDKIEQLEAQISEMQKKKSKENEWQSGNEGSRLRKRYCKS